MNLTEEHIQLNGLSVNYVHGGSGFPILFLHNGNGFWQSWKHQLDYFSQHYTVYALDWPGCGESEQPVTPLFLDVMHVVLEEFVSALGLNKFHLVGNCIGASEALKYSITHPSHVDKLVLMNICPGDLLLPRWVNKEKVASFRTNPSAMRKRAKLLAALFPSVITKRVFPKILFGNSIRSSDPLFRKYRRRQKEPNQARTKVDMYFAAHSYNLMPIIENEKVPKHILLWGEENKVADLKQHGIWHYRQLASDEFHVITKAGHLCAYERPHEVNALIEKYLNASTSEK